MTTRILALALPLPLLANLACAPPCTDDGLHQDCDDESAMSVADEESDDDDDDDDDDETSDDDDADDDDTSTSPIADEGDTSIPSETGSDDASFDDDAGTSTDEGVETSSSEGRTDPPADEWESCATNECVEGTACTDVTGLEDYDPFCSPACETDDDCPAVGGGVESMCALIPEGELDAQRCVIVCSMDDDALGDCPGAMECIDVPGQTQQVGVCMWS